MYERYHSAIIVQVRFAFKSLPGVFSSIQWKYASKIGDVVYCIHQVWQAGFLKKKSLAGRCQEPSESSHVESPSRAAELPGHCTDLPRRISKSLGHHLAVLGRRAWLRRRRSEINTADTDMSRMQNICAVKVTATQRLLQIKVLRSSSD
jgi:hypothetical protein